MYQSVSFIRISTAVLAASSLLATVSHAASVTLATTVTFESNQGYSIGNVQASTNGGLTGAPYNGQQGWSRSTATHPGLIVSTLSSGEYGGGMALSASSDGTAGKTYIGGKLGGIAATGVNSITFDARGDTGITVGFLGDNGNGLFDQYPDTGIGFGAGGASNPRIEARYAGFGTEIFNPGGAAAPSSQWFHYSVLIGESEGGFRGITMSVRNLTTATNVNLGGAGGSWTFSVTDAQFGVAPENADGIWVRITQPWYDSGYVDNLTFTAVPEPSTALLGGLGLLALLRRRRG